jgi:hypothetical protein
MQCGRIDTVKIGARKFRCDFQTTYGSGVPRQAPRHTAPVAQLRRRSAAIVPGAGVGRQRIARIFDRHGREYAGSVSRLLGIPIHGHRGNDELAGNCIFEVGSHAIHSATPVPGGNTCVYGELRYRERHDSQFSADFCFRADVFGQAGCACSQHMSPRGGVDSRPMAAYTVDPRPKPEKTCPRCSSFCNSS